MQISDDMTPRQFRTRAEKLFGPRWQSWFARKIGKDPATVRRWVMEPEQPSAAPVPEEVEALIEALEAVKKAGGDLPERFQR